MQWFHHLIAGWDKLDYLTIAAFVVPFLIATSAILGATVNWQRHFIRRSDVASFAMLWIIIALIISIVLIALVRLGVPQLGWTWIRDRPYS